MFKERLTHKAQLVGKRVETVSQAYTSQLERCGQYCTSCKSPTFE